MKKDTINKLISFYSSKKIVLVLVACLLFLTYLKLLTNDPLLGYDDIMLVRSAARVSNVYEYWLALKQGAVADLQPIRDLSYYLDIQLKSVAPFYSFHLTNMIIWYAIVIMFQAILFQVTLDRKIIFLLMLIYCFSPVSASAVAWIAARKHLLSTLFILIPTSLVVQRKENAFTIVDMALIIIFYLLSCLSQPINVLWPVWFFFYSKQFHTTRRNNFLFTLLISIMAIVMGSNYYYYQSNVFINMANNTKFVSSELYDAGSAINAIGRYFFLCLFPFNSLPTPHSQESLQNAFGALGFVVFVVYIYFKGLKNKYEIFTALLYFLLPLLVVSLKRTNIFCSDTYLINSSIGIYWSIALLLNNFKLKNVVYVMLFFYSIFSFFYTYKYVDSFINDKVLWNYSYEKEPTPHSAMMVTLQKVGEKDFEAAYSIIDNLQDRWPDYIFLPQLISEAVFFNGKISESKKEEIISKIKPQTPATYFYLTLIYAKEKNVLKVKSTVNKILLDSQKMKKEFQGREEKVAAIYSYTCNYFKIVDCLSLELIKENIKKSNFNDKIYHDDLDNRLLPANNFNVNLQPVI